jgi:enolase
MLKCTVLTTETSASGMNKKVIPELIGATVTISKSFRKYLSNTPGKHKVKKLQTTVILGIAHTHVRRKALMQQYKTCNIGNAIYNMYCKISAVLYQMHNCKCPE